MSAITGIFVSLTTAGDPAWAGTDNHVYLGVVGTVGGREFALGVPRFDDYERGTSVGYSIGDGAEIFAGRKPLHGDAAFEEMMICQPNVTHVYLRKQGNLSHSDDDAWRLERAVVYILGPTVTRVFSTTGPATLGNEYGLQLWMGEVAHSGSFRNAQIPIDGIADCQRR